MNEDVRLLVEHYRPETGAIVPHELYRRMRSDGVSSTFAGVVLREVVGLGMRECLQVMRDCGDDPLEGSSP